MRENLTGSPPQLENFPRSTRTGLEVVRLVGCIDSAMTCGIKQYYNSYKYSYWTLRDWLVLNAFVVPAVLSTGRTLYEWIKLSRTLGTDSHFTVPSNTAVGSCTQVPGTRYLRSCTGIAVLKNLLRHPCGTATESLSLETLVQFVALVTKRR
eukprot:3208243-Rhodomonas_salina.1